MKKFSLTIAILFYFSAITFALPPDEPEAATSQAATDIEKVWDDGQVQMRYTYASTTAVTAGNTTVFKIPAENVYGKIIEISFESSCTNCNVWLSGEDSQVITDVDNFVVMEDINLRFTPDLPTQGRTYINRDDPQTAYIYVTIDNDSGVSTGNWQLIIQYIRK